MTFLIISLYIIGLVASFFGFTYMSAYKEYYTDYNDDLFAAICWPISVSYNIIKMAHRRTKEYAHAKRKLDEKNAALPSHHKTKLGLKLYK